MSRDRHRTRYLFDRILASDPSLNRLRSGLRALVIGTLAAGNLWLSGALFLATIFNSFEMHRFGPRGPSLGTISYQSFFYAMPFKNPPDKAGWLPLFVVIGCAIAFAVHFWLVPEHPGRMLKSELRAYRARIAVLLHDLARCWRTTNMMTRPGASGSTPTSRP